MGNSYGYSEMVDCTYTLFNLWKVSSAIVIAVVMVTSSGKINTDDRVGVFNYGIIFSE